MFACIFFTEDLESEADLRETTRPSTTNATKHAPKANTQVRPKYNLQLQYLLMDQNESFMSRLCSIGVDRGVSTAMQFAPVVQRADNVIQRMKCNNWSTFYPLGSDLSTG